MKCSKAPQLFLCDLRLQRIQTLFDLIRSLIRKSQNDHLLIWNLLLVMQIHDLCDKNRRLTASHIGVHKTGAALIENGCFLVFI